MSAFHFQSLTPDLILDALAALGMGLESGLTPLNSYENRVYQFQAEDRRRYVVKFYRPERWSAEQIREEHQLARRLAAAEVPVAVPLGINDATLHEHGGYLYALWPSLGGRHLEPDNLEQLELVGCQLGRWHQAAQAHPFTARPTMVPVTDLLPAIALLKESRFWPTDLKHDFPVLLDRLGEGVCRGWNEDWQPIPLHGDSHPGNILWRDGPLFVDLDDSRMGPAIQDLWMLLSGEVDEQRLQLDALLYGYEQFADFEPAQLRLIEPLRTWRMIQHLAWLVRRWPDPAFPCAFPWFTTEQFWHQQFQLLSAQLAALAAPPITLTPGY